MPVIDHQGYPGIIDLILSHLPNPASASVFRATSKAFRSKVDAAVAAKVRHVVIASAYSPGPPMLVFRHPDGGNFLPPLTETRLAALLAVNPLILGYATMTSKDAYLRKRFADVEVIEIHTPIRTIPGLYKLFPRLKVLRLSGGDTLTAAGLTVHSATYTVSSTDILNLENQRGGGAWEDENGRAVGNDSDWEDDEVPQVESFFALRPRKVAIDWDMATQTCVLETPAYPEEIHLILGRCHEPSATKSYIPAINGERLTHIFLHFTHFEPLTPLSDAHTARFVYEMSLRAGVGCSICLVDADDFLSQLPEPPLAPREETLTTLSIEGNELKIIHPPAPDNLVDFDSTDVPGFDALPPALGNAILDAASATYREVAHVMEAMRMWHGLPPTPPSGSGSALQHGAPSYLPLWTTTSQMYKSEVGAQLYRDLTGC
jgi:hypothetical protein